MKHSYLYQILFTRLDTGITEHVTYPSRKAAQAAFDGYRDYFNQFGMTTTMSFIRTRIADDEVSAVVCLAVY